VQPGKGHTKKMNFEILETSSTVAKTGLYEVTIFKIKNTKVVVTKFVSTCRLADYYGIQVCNASNRAFRGMGKQFANIDKALEHYTAKNMQALLNSLK
jgi:hypothetical protein